ncbi:hypothetical protein B5X24_HaOG209772 [Helicoverpa armigera]|nr:hypothetical protein B5X24_HaOG209772 [Helicoverpa armigera]
MEVSMQHAASMMASVTAPAVPCELIVADGFHAHRSQAASPLRAYAVLNCTLGVSKSLHHPFLSKIYVFVSKTSMCQIHDAQLWLTSDNCSD